MGSATITIRTRRASRFSGCFAILIVVFGVVTDFLKDEALSSGKPPVASRMEVEFKVLRMATMTVKVFPVRGPAGPFTDTTEEFPLTLY